MRRVVVGMVEPGTKFRPLLFDGEPGEKVVVREDDDGQVWMGTDLKASS